MNLSKQREKLKEVAGVIITDPKSRAKLLHAALNAPVYVWELGERDHFTAEQREFINENICVGEAVYPTIRPFDCFRISSKLGFQQWWFSEERQEWWLMGVLYACEDSRDRELWMWNSYPVTPGKNSFYNCWLDGENFTERFSVDGKVTKEGREVFRSLASWLIMFLYDITIPQNITVKVRPAKTEGRSVEWQLAREHYLIVGRKEAVASRDSKRGICAKETLVRGAHYREAHYRVLRSPVFRHKQGQKIRVKHSWVGPEEWEGLDGKIYKVIMPKD